VAGVYNRSSYERDKRKAFEILAAAIERILTAAECGADAGCGMSSFVS
jgi:hypothetical protein